MKNIRKNEKGGDVVTSVLSIFLHQVPWGATMDVRGHHCHVSEYTYARSKTRRYLIGKIGSKKAVDRFLLRPWQSALFQVCFWRPDDLAGLVADLRTGHQPALARSRHSRTNCHGPDGDRARPTTFPACRNYSKVVVVWNLFSLIHS